jgi:hypothetical protein
MADQERGNPSDAPAWLEKIANAERVFHFYQERADQADQAYANIEKMAKNTRDREMQVFWASIQVLAPSIYARPPVPVVVPRFQDRRPVRRAASELLERVCSTSFDLTDINQVMLGIRDDLVIAGRGVAWTRFESKEKGGKADDKVCIEHLDRKDFLYDPARQWCDVDWVGRRAWLTRAEMRKRFGEEVEQRATYTRQTDKDQTRDLVDPYTEKAGIWEIWCRSENKVHWIMEGYPEFLESDEPHLHLDGFFPTPQPAFATLSRRTLVPVPDYYFIYDQLREINELTDRIMKLTNGLVVRGFYPAGQGELGDAIEAAIRDTSNSRVLVPVSNFAAFGNGAAKDAIAWLPIDMVAQTIVQCVELRRQQIDDIYQIYGLSDIMRGSTAASETATAQQLKSQYGSIRIRDKAAEMVRYARDLVRISAEIISEHFSKQTLLDMSQMDLPSNADIKRAIQQIQMQQQQLQAQAQQAMAAVQQSPQAMQMAQQDPEQAQQMLQQAQQQFTQQMEQLQAQAAELAETVTIDQVYDLLRDERLRPFILDIETDSTIQPDEDAAKQRATEFITAVGGFLNQAAPLVQVMPQSAGFISTALKYVAGQYRAGREMQTSIDEFADQIQNLAQQPDPQAAAAEQQAQIEQQKLAAENERTQAEMQMKQMDQQVKMQEMQAKAQIEAQKLQAEIEAKTLEAQNKQAEHQAKLTELTLRLEMDKQKHIQEMQKMALEMERMTRDAAIKETQAAQSADIAERQQIMKESQSNAE